MHANLFELALSIEKPFFIKDIQFDVGKKRLDIFIDFKRAVVLVVKTKFVKPMIQKTNNASLKFF